uniref:Ig-like domain-containing protein n=1 Tax=Lepisosteus oculatus TaxID=7918 RepID=W5MJ22_LEPOC
EAVNLDAGVSFVLSLSDAQRTILTTETGWTQFFTEETFFLKCVVQRDPAKWTIKRKKDGKVETACTAYSLENIQKCSFISPSVSHSGKYWCESESGECSNTLNITVYSGDVILRVSPQPLSKGSTGNLSCAVRHNPNHTCGFPSIQNVVYFRNGLILHNQKNSTHDEGHFKCRVNYTLKCQKSKTSYSVESPDILVSMTEQIPSLNLTVPSTP